MEGKARQKSPPFADEVTTALDADPDLARRFTRIEPAAAQRADVKDRGAVLLVARHGSELDTWLRLGRAAIIRPDGTVLRAG
jgi:hypothetical protein